jgi:hypothetical protein
MLREFKTLGLKIYLNEYFAIEQFYFALDSKILFAIR